MGMDVLGRVVEVVSGILAVLCLVLHVPCFGRLDLEPAQLPRGKASRW